MYRLLIEMYALTLLRSTASLGTKDYYIRGGEIQAPRTVARDYATNLALTTVSPPPFFSLSYLCKEVAFTEEELAASFGRHRLGPMVSTSIAA